MVAVRSGSYNKSRRRTINKVRTYAFCFGLVLLLGVWVNVVQLRFVSTMVPDRARAMNEYFASKGMLRRRSTQALDSQDVSFRQILKRTLLSQQMCSQDTPYLGNETQTKQQLQQEEKSPYWPPFGIIKDVDSFMAEPKGQDCLIPPTTSCDTTAYSILVTAGETGNTNLRTLLVNLLLFLTFPNVQEIVLLVLFDEDTLKQDEKYGQRIMKWQNLPHHKVRVVFAPSNASTSSTSLKLWQSIRPTLFKSNAVFWANGDVFWPGNSRGVNAGFELWKRHSQSLVSSSGYKVQAEGASSHWNAHQTKLLQGALEKEKRPLPTQQIVSNFTLQDSFFLPSCPNWRLRLERGDDNFQFVDVSAGLFVHRNLFCVLQSGVFQTVRDVLLAKSANVLTEKAVIGIALAHVTGELPRHYPHTVKANKQQKQETKRAGRRLDSRETDTRQNDLPGLGFDQSRALRLKKEKHPKRRTVTSAKKQPPVALKEATAPPSRPSLDKELVSEMLRYFGNIPSGSIGWCTGAGCDKNNGYLKDLPWMSRGGLGHSLCYTWSDKLI